MSKHYKTKIIAEDVERYIASNSSLTRSQVSECFNVYYDMLVELSQSEHIDKDNIQITFPHIGYFYYNKYKGRKKGSTYNIPITAGSKEMKKVTLEEDENGHYRLSFRVTKGLEDLVKSLGV